MNKRKLWRIPVVILCIIVWVLFAIHCYIDNLPYTYRRDRIIVEPGNEIDNYYEEYLYEQKYSLLDVDNINRDIIKTLPACAADYENCSFFVTYRDSEWQVYRDQDEFQGWVSSSYLAENGVSSAPFYARKLETDTMLFIQAHGYWYQTIIPNEQIILYNFADGEANIDLMHFYDFPHGNYFKNEPDYFDLYPIGVDYCSLNGCGHINSLIIDGIRYSKFEGFGSAFIYPVKINKNEVQNNSSLYSLLGWTETDKYLDLSNKTSEEIVSILANFSQLNVDESMLYADFMANVFTDWDVVDDSNAMPEVYIDELEFVNIWEGENGNVEIFYDKTWSPHASFRLVVKDDILAQSIYQKLEDRLGDIRTRKIVNGEYISCYHMVWDDGHGDCWACKNDWKCATTLRIEPSQDGTSTIISGIMY